MDGKMEDGGSTDTSSTWSMVSFSKEFEDYHDEQFDGSLNEHQKFTEVLNGNDSSGSSKRCQDINIESIYAKKTDHLSFGLNNESSPLTSQAESFNFILDSIGVGSPGAGCHSEDLALSTKNNCDVNLTRVKLAAEDRSDAKDDLTRISDSSVPLKGAASCTSQQPSDFGGKVTCHLVESSNQRITSRRRVLKQSVKIDRVYELGEKDISKRIISGSDESELEEIVLNKPIASPVSQEIYATKVLVYPSIAAAYNSETHRPAKPKWKDSCFVELDEAELSIIRDSINDPRPLLRYHIHQLFRASGWVVGRRNRNKGFHSIGEYVFKSPEGRPIREFRKAWISCGKQLLFYANNVLPASDCKMYADMTQLRSDLSSTVAQIEEKLGHMEPTAALAYAWCLLDPFANVVFIDKTIRSFKQGKAAKAKRSLVTESQAASGSCMVLKDALPVCKEDQSGLLDSFSCSAAKYRNVSCSEASNLDENSLTGSGSHGTSSDQTDIFLFEVPISTWNTHTLTGSEIVFPQQYSGTSCTQGKCKEEAGDLDSQVESALQGSVYGDSSCSKYGFEDIRLVDIEINNDSLMLNKISEGKFRKKSKRISKIRLSSLYEDNKFGLPTSQYDSIEKTQQISPCSSQRSSNLKQKRYGLRHESASKKSKTCRIKDDDLLISAIIKNKAFESTGKQSIRKSKPPRKQKSKKSGCKLLLRSLSKGGKQFTEGKLSAFGTRTVLSWLINSGVVSVNEVIQYRNPKDDSVVKDGLITWEGVLCKCCNKLLSISEFKSHAGFRLNRPCLNLFMDFGKPWTLCLLEAWSAEYKDKKVTPRTVKVEEVDQNDDSCGRCGDGGELLCCDNCPSTFHQACLYAEDLPEGSWYCPHCTCRICGNVVSDKKDSEASKCAQCERKYHMPCMEEKDIKNGLACDTWFCGESCLKVYSGLQSRIGLMNSLPDGYSWTLLRCIHGDQKVHSAQRFVALKAECNSKLAVALTIMEECFLPMVDPRTGIDMIPHVVYNWGSQFARLNYCGFYTVVLEKDDIVTCVASLRIHGVTVAEMPLIATCCKYRRQGMCRRLLNSTEEMLKSLKVEMLVISAISGLVDTWTVGFGFKPLEDDEKRRLSEINLMVFPGTVWLKKPLYDNKNASLGIPPAPHHTCVTTEAADCLEGCNADSGKLTHDTMSVEEADTSEESRRSKGENLQIIERKCSRSLVHQLCSEEQISPSEEKKLKYENIKVSTGQAASWLDDQLPNLIFEEPHSSLEGKNSSSEMSLISQDQAAITEDSKVFKLSFEEDFPSELEIFEPNCENFRGCEDRGGSSLDTQLAKPSSEDQICHLKIDVK